MMVADGWMDNSLIAEKTPKLQINYNPIDVEQKPTTATQEMRVSESFEASPIRSSDIACSQHFFTCI